MVLLVVSDQDDGPTSEGCFPHHRQESRRLPSALVLLPIQYNNGECFSRIPLLRLAVHCRIPHCLDQNLQRLFVENFDKPFSFPAHLMVSHSLKENNNPLLHFGDISDRFLGGSEIWLHRVFFFHDCRAQKWRGQGPVFLVENNHLGRSELDDQEGVETDEDSILVGCLWILVLYCPIFVIGLFLYLVRGILCSKNTGQLRQGMSQTLEIFVDASSLMTMSGMWTQHR